MSPRPNDPYVDAPRLPEGEAIDPRALVRSEAGLELEIGPGRGHFIIERLQADPHVGMIGLEIRRKWATLVDRKIASLGFGARGRVFAADARLALPRFPDACLRRIYVHFPDPWWKKRHHKRLVVSSWFVDQAARLLEPGADVYLQTDVPERAEAYAQAFAAHPGFSRVEVVGDPGALEFGARSPRERRALEDGLPIHRLRFRTRG